MSAAGSSEISGASRWLAAVAPSGAARPVNRAAIAAAVTTTSANASPPLLTVMRVPPSLPLVCSRGLFASRSAPVRIRRLMQRDDGHAAPSEPRTPRRGRVPCVPTCAPRRGSRRSARSRHGGSTEGRRACPAGASGRTSPVPRHTVRYVRAPTRARRRPGSTAARAAPHARAPRASQGGFGGRRRRRPTPRRCGRRSPRAAGRSRRRLRAAAAAARRFPARSWRSASSETNCGSGTASAARRARPIARGRFPRAASSRASCSSANTYPGRSWSATRSCISARPTRPARRSSFASSTLAHAPGSRCPAAASAASCIARRAPLRSPSSSRA